MKKPVYIFSNGELKRKDNTLFFENEEGKKYIPVNGTSEIHIFGEVDINKRFLEFATTSEIILHFYNYYGYYAGTYYPREHLNSGYMILKQAEHYLDNEKRLELAKEFGATHVINSQKEDLQEAIFRLTDGKGVDKAFECVGLEVTLTQVLLSLKKNGLATMVGIFENPTINLNVARFITHEIRLQGSQGYCWDFPIAINMAKKIPLEKLVTHVFPLDRLSDAFAAAFDRTQNAIKIQISMD